MTRMAWVWLIFLSLTITHDAGAQQFQPVTYYHAGNGPRQVVTADFNNDGNLDLAVSLEDEGKVAVLLGRGDGSFLPPLKFRAQGAIGLAVGDLNNDGKPDMVVTRIAGSVGRLNVYLGNGDGTFTYQPDFYPSGLVPLGVVVADFNGDGKLDVAIANRWSRGEGNGCVFVRFGEGDGKLGPAVRYSVAGHPWGLVAGDLNADGHPDLVVSEDNNFSPFPKHSLIVLMNNGDGTFHQAAEYLPGEEETLDAAIADLNHDGKPDLVVAESFGQRVAVLLGNGDGTFGSPTFYSTTSLGQAPTGVVVADFNLDGIPDIAFGMYNGDPLADSGLLYGNGDGSFQSPIPILGNLDGGYSLTAGDFDNDGAPDLAIPILYQRKIAVLLNTR